MVLIATEIPAPRCGMAFRAPRRLVGVRFPRRQHKLQSVEAKCRAAKAGSPAFQLWGVIQEPYIVHKARATREMSARMRNRYRCNGEEFGTNRLHALAHPET